MLMKIIKLYFLMALALLSGGCKGWLTIDSSDRIMENTLFETEEGFFTALNGVYAELPQADLYGKSLAAVTFDVQAQYFDTTQPSTHTFNTLGAYSAEARKTAVADTWDKAYFVIANVNKILEHCESDRDVLSDRAYHIIRGEMLGMRALLHFEMLRIFGPVFAEAPARVSIPYRTSSELTVTPLLPANEVAEKIAGDFTDALSELAEWDPVRTEGRLNGETTGSVRYRSRHLRLNYFAVKALQARLAIYTGDRTLAGRLARKATSLPATGTLSNDLTEEYIREFVGEGQLFWYYKRLRKTSIRKVYSNNGGYLEFDPANYLFALPEKEQEHHQ